jgi:hypothetical protein
MTSQARQTKLSRVLSALAAGRSYNRFEAERQLSDHSLHSTVSDIQAKGVPVFRQPEVVPGYQGAPTWVKRYWILPEDRAKAKELLEGTKKPAVGAAGESKGAA